MNTRTLIAAMALFLPLFVSGSEESFVPWNSAVIKSAGSPETGPIEVEAVATEGGFASLSISAFGKKEPVSKEDLVRLQGFPLSGIVLTQEPGYEVIGGHTVHVRLTRTFYDGAKVLKKATLVISLPKKASLKVMKMPEVSVIAP